ncbi:hypothetical protein SAMN02949497_2755 [Methylomagnum ishizawai]|uniref:Uncharacterized protein n=1 Tax=Methylomagnum ishizawai TaxID=1760988 RepID=A0A1Y6D4D1_9GAMM|nr:hypothetical protein [Methylomagnum ishizawai]SMF95392.1 hypothetical protein SAMN02949497_2755 [Methylomagnum ishizawai]
MHKTNFLKKGLLALSLLLPGALPTTTWAHGGASVDTDQCRIFVGPHLVHFTAYQPQLTGTTEYCNSIPELGSAVLVFDYEGKALRDMTVEFEITKEPEGTRVYYAPPSAHSKGTFNTTVNFTEPSKYLGHVTLINEGQKIDAHIPFTVGSAQGGPSATTYIIFGVVLLAAGYIGYLSNASFKNAVDGLLNKKA